MADRGKDQEANKHPDAAGDEGLATSVVLNQIQTDERDEEIDGVENDLSDETVNLNALKDRGTVIEEVIRTS